MCLAWGGGVFGGLVWICNPWLGRKNPAAKSRRDDTLTMQIGQTAGI